MGWQRFIGDEPFRVRSDQVNIFTESGVRGIHVVPLTVLKAIAV
jgi:hypothetical protein